MTVTLVLSAHLSSDLMAAAAGDIEAAGVLLARPVEAGGDLRLLGRAIHWVSDSAYQRRTDRELVVTSDGYVPALGFAEESGCVAIWFHSHPGDGARVSPSERDNQVDRELAETFRVRSGARFYATLIVGHDGDRLTFTGRVEADDEVRPIARIWTIGDWFTLTISADAPDLPLQEVFDRNVRAFGGGVQRVLGDLHIAIIGTGGTGSAVAEQLVRLGVRHFTLIDPDILSLSNTTRVYGSTPGDVGRPKVDVVRDHLMRIAPDAAVATIQGMITREATARALTTVDLVFGCTDDNAGRLILSRLATFLLLPVIDCGVLLSSSEGGHLQGIDGRVTVLVPGAACLVCRGRIDMQRASAEAMTAEEQGRLAGEGYAPALHGVEPAVVAFTTHVAAAAVGELIERLVHYGPSPVPSEILLRLHDREMSTNLQDPRDRHYCHPDQGKHGLGMTEPFLEQLWRQ